MAILILLIILLGAILNGATAVLEGDDAVHNALYGAAGGATAVAIIAGLLWVVGLFVEFDLSTVSL